MKTKILKYISIFMMIVAVIFVVIAFIHPEFAWPWSNTITYIIYGMYLFIMSVTFVVGRAMSEKEK